jgi:FRG domain
LIVHYSNSMPDDSSNSWPRFANNVERSSVGEAVALATQWQEDGLCDWFRGQSTPWALVPSQLRLTDEEEGAASESRSRFLLWILSLPGIPAITCNAEAILAVAQHYGMPTAFLDFSTDLDVAAFFATHDRNQKQDSHACLVCIHSEHFVTEWNSRCPSNLRHRLSTIRVDVPDLWRLQSQKGTFLEVPYLDIELVLAPRRILFPFTSRWPRPPADHIIPVRKSSLEQLLDHYFEVEHLVRAARENREWLESLRSNGIEIREVRMRPPKPFPEQYLDSSKIAALEKWDASVINS